MLLPIRIFASDREVHEAVEKLALAYTDYPRWQLHYALWAWLKSSMNVLLEDVVYCVNDGTRHSFNASEFAKALGEPKEAVNL